MLSPSLPVSHKACCAITGLDYTISHGSHNPDLLHVSTTSKADDFITSSRLKFKDVLTSNVLVKALFEEMRIHWQRIPWETSVWDFLTRQTIQYKEIYMVHLPTVLPETFPFFSVELKPSQRGKNHADCEYILKDTAYE